MFSQRGENKNGGVLVTVKPDIQTTRRLECTLLNVCVFKLTDEEILRIVRAYTPESKSWIWKDLSTFLLKKYVVHVFGDFNADLNQDGKKAEAFLK